MGNLCAGPYIGFRGFFQTFGDAIWKTRPPGDRLPSPDSESNTNASNAANKSSEVASKTRNSVDSSKPAGTAQDTDAAAPVQSKPPKAVTIQCDDHNRKEEKKEEKKSDAYNKEEKKKEEKKGDDHNKEEIRKEEKKPVDADKPTQFKRVASVGLQLDCILGRKTGNVKEQYTLGRKLGQGQFGTTFLCLEKGTSKQFACKTIAKRKLTSKEDVEDVRREIQIMHHLEGHPHVIQIVDAFEDALAVHVVMELCAGGELFDRIIQRGHYTEKKAAELARVIVGVVEACHSLGVMHRDLKPENFLFVNQEEEAPLKTIDFGLSMFFKPGTNHNWQTDLLICELLASCFGCLISKEQYLLFFFNHAPLPK